MNNISLYKNKKMNTKKFGKIIYSVWKLIQESLILWITLLIFILSKPILILILNTIDKNLLSTTLFLSLIPQLILLVFDFLIINKLFSNSKTDIDNLIFSHWSYYSKTKIFWEKIFLIMLISFAACFLQFAINTIICCLLLKKISWVLFFFVSDIFVNFLIELFYVLLITSFTLFFKQFWFKTSFVFLFSLVSLPVFTRLIDYKKSSNLIENNLEEKNLYSKLVFKSDGKEISLIGKEKNIHDTNLTKRMNKIDSTSVFHYFVPGEIFLSCDSLLLKSIIQTDSEIEVNNSYSLIKTHYKNVYFENYQIDNDVITLLPYDKNPLLFNNSEYENLLLDNLYQIMLDKVNYIDLNNTNLIDHFLNTLKTKFEWTSNNFTKKELNTLKAILGIESKFSQLFYYLHDYSWLKQKTPNLENIITSKLNKQMTELLKFLWNDKKTKINLFIFNMFGNINEIYPNIKKIDIKSKPALNDLFFLQNDLIKFNKDKIFYLNSDNDYVLSDINFLKDIDSSIIDYESYKNFVLSNFVSIEFVQKFLNQLKNKMLNLYDLIFSNNKIDFYKYDEYFKIEEQSYLPYSQICPIILLLMVNFLIYFYYLNFNYVNE